MRAFYCFCSFQQACKPSKMVLEDARNAIKLPLLLLFRAVLTPRTGSLCCVVGVIRVNVWRPLTWWNLVSCIQQIVPLVSIQSLLLRIPCSQFCTLGQRFCPSLLGLSGGPITVGECSWAWNKLIPQILQKFFLAPPNTFWCMESPVASSSFPPYLCEIIWDVTILLLPLLALPHLLPSSLPASIQGIHRNPVHKGDYYLQVHWSCYGIANLTDHVHHLHVGFQVESTRRGRWTP